MVLPAINRLDIRNSNTNEKVKIRTFHNKLHVLVLNYILHSESNHYSKPSPIILINTLKK